ncbi:MAG: hypothetical protein HN981_03520 [Candidatus Pacebacteria bacterium]|jgi:hypothetical protein|nr:hypothetical protein [Candidatus Paceibacterota bacterium]MBT4652240.1 hypothetical protein [Candidatus Paceibacterota bacterium]MBT6756652.1 hypothetical protein [Candidatus Paceibacterota bacterium]MBT6921432.1 hypothetical protein [Candidatus Paceibacterota bacterium]
MARPIPKYVRYPLKIAFILCILLTITAGVSFPFLQPIIPIFYSLSQPEKQLVGKAWIFFFPVFAWITLLIHTLILQFFTQIESNVQKIFAWTTIGTVTIDAILLIRIIMVIT